MIPDVRHVGAYVKKLIMQKLNIIRIFYDVMAATSQIVWCHSRIKEVSYTSLFAYSWASSTTEGKCYYL